MKKLIPLFSGLLILLAGCAFRPLKPGIGYVMTPDGFVAGFKQSENPQAGSKQKYKRITVDPAGNHKTDEFETELGPAQKDTAREVAAKLSSLKGVVWVGVFVFLFGAASLFYPPLKLIVGSTTTSLVACAAGVCLIVLPSMIAGNEGLIFAIAGGGVLLYWFSHRHGQLRGTVENLTKK